MSFILQIYINVLTSVATHFSAEGLIYPVLQCRSKLSASRELLFPQAPILALREKVSPLEAQWGPSVFEARAQSIPTRFPIMHLLVHVGDVTRTTKQNTDGPVPDQALLGGRALVLGSHLACASDVFFPGSRTPAPPPPAPAASWTLRTVLC